MLLFVSMLNFHTVSNIFIHATLTGLIVLGKLNLLAIFINQLENYEEELCKKMMMTMATSFGI